MYLYIKSHACIFTYEHTLLSTYITGFDINTRINNTYIHTYIDAYLKLSSYLLIGVIVSALFSN